MATIGFRAGEAYIQVNPSVEGWNDSIREQLHQNRGEAVEVPIEPHADLEALDRQIEELGQRIQSKIEQVVGNGNADSPLNQALREQINALGSELDEAVRQRELLIDTAQAEAKAAELNATLDDAVGHERKVEVSTTEAEAKARVLGEDLDEAVERERVAHVNVVEQRTGATDSVDSTEYVSGSEATRVIREDVDNGEAIAKTAETEAAVESLPDEKTIKVTADTSEAEASISAFGTLLAGLGSTLSPLGGALTGGLGAGLTFIPGAVIGLGTLKEATSGATEALSAYNQMQETAARFAPQVAQAQSQAAERIQSAQQQLTSAESNLANTRENVANAAISAAERVQTAQEAVATAQETASRNVESALRRQQKAEEELQRAQEEETRAQENLVTARQEAAIQLQDLGFQVQDNALSQREASIRLREARAVQQSHGTLPAGSLQAEKDQLAVDEAQQRIVELAAKQKELADKKATADKQGIDGNPRVVAAQDAVTRAVQRTADAHQAVADAAQAVQQAQIDGARRVEDAQRRLADAQRAQAQQAVQGAHQIENAQNAVTRAQEALAKAHDATSQAANRNAQAHAAYEYALSKLTPAGQEFVKFLETLVGPQGLLRQIQHSAEDGFLPGLESGIKAGLADLPQFNDLIGVTATELGKLADQAGHALTGPVWTNWLRYMTVEAPYAIGTFGRIAGNTFTAFAGYAEAFQPIFRQWGDAFVNMTARWAAAGQQARAGSAPFMDFLTFVRQSGTEVSAFFRQLADFIGHVALGLAGPGLGTLSALTGVLKVLNTIDPQILGLLIQMFLAAKTFGASGIGGIFTNLATGMQKTGDEANALGKAFAWMGAAPATVGKISGALGALGAALPLIGVAVTAAAYAWEAFKDKAADAADAVVNGTKNMAAAVSDQEKHLQTLGIAQEDQLRQDGALLVDSNEATNADKIHAQAVADVTAALKAKLAAMDPLSRAQAEAKIAQSEYNDALRDNPPNSKAVADALANLKQKNDDAALAVDNNKRATEGYTDSLKRLSDEIDKSLDAKIAVMNADLQLKEATKQVNDAVAQGGKNTADYTRAQASLLSAVKAQIDAAGQEAEANYKGADSNEKARLGAAAHDAALIKLAQSQDGPVRDAALETIKNLDSTQLATLNTTLATQNLHVEVVQLPTGKEIKITTPGLDQVLADLNRLNDEIQKIASTPAIPLLGAVGTVIGGATAAGNQLGRALGGPIHGPGGPTDDRVPALLSNGEHVLTAREVQAAGGHEAIFNLRSAILSGMTPKKYASGGPVGDYGTSIGVIPLNVELQISELQGFKDLQSRVASMVQALTAAATVGGDVGAWIAQAMAITGVPAYWAGGLATIIQRESGGNPNAINLWDSNAAAGHPSQGLMQTIPGTFESYRDPRLVDNILDPVANIVAGINYIKARYGDISNVQQANPNLPPRGYDSGGWLPPGMHTVVNATRQPERVLSAKQTAVFEDAMHHLTRHGPSGGDTWNISPPPEWDYLRMAQEVDRLQDLRDRATR